MTATREEVAGFIIKHQSKFKRFRLIEKCGCAVFGINLGTSLGHALNMYGSGITPLRLTSVVCCLAGGLVAFKIIGRAQFFANVHLFTAESMQRMLQAEDQEIVSYYRQQASMALDLLIWMTENKWKWNLCLPPPCSASHSSSAT